MQDKCAPFGLKDGLRRCLHGKQETKWIQVFADLTYSSGTNFFASLNQPSQAQV